MDIHMGSLGHPDREGNIMKEVVHHKGTFLGVGHMDDIMLFHMALILSLLMHIAVDIHPFLSSSLMLHLPLLSFNKVIYTKTTNFIILA